MNKILKYFFMAFAFAVTIVSCTDEYEYDPAKPFKANEYGVYFYSHEDKVAIAEGEEGFSVYLARENTEGELTVPLNVTAPDFISVPSTAVFANGEETAEIKVKVGDDAELCKKYDLKISIPDEYLTNPYSEEIPGWLTFDTKVVKEDYKVVAKGIFAENILFGQRWYQMLEYSETTGFYRLPDLIAEGTHFYFIWDGTTDETQTFYFCDDDGDMLTTMKTGYSHRLYGMISAAVISDYFMGYDDTDNVFYFPWEMTVSAGSFGKNYDYFLVTEWLNGND